ncbi:MAG: GNAT family N-acetyltransferase [Candidatus Izemoplasmatales bacterium]|nr:GNAT family N-acetyltransferase [Candidatus Izemoplasmatales bacterium]
MIRKAQKKDIDGLENMAKLVTNDLHQRGIDQWSNIYPTRHHFESDLEKNGLYVYETNGNVIGSISILDVDDDSYQTIAWCCSHSQVIHRMMVDPHHLGEGVGSGLLRHAIDLIFQKGFDSIKVDTHPDNVRMKKILLAFGFQTRGYLVAINRDAFELVLNKR